MTSAGTIDVYAKIGDPMVGQPFEHCPSLHWQIAGADWMAEGARRRELGGVEQYRARERLTDRPLPREVAGTLTLDPVNGPHGFRPVYFLGRQIDDAKAYTSPMYVTFG